MEDWEDDSFEPALPVKVESKSNWEEEDVEEEDVKESWEDEDVPPAPAPAPAPASASAEKAAPKPAAKHTGKKGEQPEGKSKQPAKQVADEGLADPVAEKLRQQRLVEEADYKSTAELFAKKEDGKTLDNFIPKSESDFIEYAELLSHKIRPYEKSFHYMGLLKAVMRLSMTSLKAADAKDIASSVTAIANEKLKAEKEANAGKKKQGGKKKQLHVERAADDMITGAYDDVGDDYDFM